MKKIFFSVTNDLTSDQRMHRICTSLSENNYNVTLVGRKLSFSAPLQQEKFKQKRIRCWFKRSKWFYAEYNIRLFFFLLFRKIDAVCAIDLDTILPCLFISRLKRIPRIYDAHELFTELKEVVTRSHIKKQWTRIEKYAVPKFKWGYTVSESIAEEFYRRYNVKYKVVLNVPVLKKIDTAISHKEFILYQGAVNEARGFEFLIPAMNKINSKLIVCGDGNFMGKLKDLIKENDAADKVELKGMLLPNELWEISLQAKVGITIIENTGMNQYYSLPNKFFDYIHAGVPQIAVNYPEYKKINDCFEVAILLNEINPEIIASAVNNLLYDDVLYERLRKNCDTARQELNWQNEEKKLVDFYNKIFN